MSTEQANEKKPQNPLISRSSILILGGLLVGVTWSEGFGASPGSSKFYACLAALVAFLAFVALDLVGQRSKARALQLAHQEAIEKLERRVNRHLTEETVLARSVRGAPSNMTAVR